MIALWMRWFVITRMQVFLLADNGIGLNTSTTTIWHGCIVYSQRQPVVCVWQPCLLAWQTSHCRICNRTSLVSPSQYYCSCRQLVAKLALEWACLWVSQINSSPEACRQTTCSFSWCQQPVISTGIPGTPWGNPSSDRSIGTQRLHVAAAFRLVIFHPSWPETVCYRTAQDG